MPRFFEIVRDERGNVDIVFDDKNAGHAELVAAHGGRRLLLSITVARPCPSTSLALHTAEDTDACELVGERVSNA